MLAHEISYVPSVSILAGLRQELQERRAAPRTILVITDPVFGADDERLAGPGRGAVGSVPDGCAHTGREAHTVARLVPPPQRRIASGFEATRGLAQSPEIGRYRIVHFATHALVNNTHPALSGILLSQVGPDGREQEGMLRAHEIVDLKLSADLVVLSSCSTGVGQKLWGEGLISLTRAFLRAGAGAGDGELVGRGRRGHGGAHVALLRAPSSVPARRPPRPPCARPRSPCGGSGRRAPYYWAAFGIQGEYRRPLSKTLTLNPPAPVIQHSIA